MSPYSVQLPDGSTVDIIKKTQGRRRSVKFIFFKIPRKKTLIAYTAKFASHNTAHIMLFKFKRTGVWTSRYWSSDPYCKRLLKHQIPHLKQAIDQHEQGINSLAYRELFYF